jgi:hypothetical protein
MTERSEIKGLIEKAYAARVKGDLDALMTYFHPDCRFQLMGAAEREAICRPLEGCVAVRGSDGRVHRRFQIYEFRDAGCRRRRRPSRLSLAGRCDLRADRPHRNFPDARSAEFRGRRKVRSLAQFTDTAGVSAHHGCCGELSAFVIAPITAFDWRWPRQQLGSRPLLVEGWPALMNILSIQSHVAYGHVGNASAVFPMQRLGVEVWPIHTVQFSNHTGYGAWKGQVFDGATIDELMTGIGERRRARQMRRRAVRLYGLGRYRPRQSSRRWQECARRIPRRGIAAIR